MCMAHTPAPLCAATAQHLGVSLKRRDIVNDFRAGGECLAGHCRFGSINRNRYVRPPAKLGNHGQYSAEFLRFAHRGGIRASALASHVQEVRALFQ